jgi:hypothetical protein
MPNKYLLVVGNLSEGFRFEGPFETFDDADFDSYRHDEVSWVATLHSPCVEWNSETGEYEEKGDDSDS